MLCRLSAPDEHYTQCWLHPRKQCFIYDLFKYAGIIRHYSNWSARIWTICQCFHEFCQKLIIWGWQFDLISEWDHIQNVLSSVPTAVHVQLVDSLVVKRSPWGRFTSGKFLHTPRMLGSVLKSTHAYTKVFSDDSHIWQSHLGPSCCPWQM